ncbi:MAG: sulfur carrier protein ThiS [Gammaproteobacteria bacterium]|nr:sulfur carrier protein ThiS [Gammaproteobacteria bacterium]
MNIILNGIAIQLDAGTSLNQLIEKEGLAGKRLAAEVNHEIISKSEHVNLILNDGDKVEIVHAIGGG